MNIKPIEDKLKDFLDDDSKLLGAGDIYKWEFVNFVIENWSNEEENLFGSTADLLTFIYDNYFKFFTFEEVSLSVLLKLINKFKNKALNIAMMYRTTLENDLAREQINPITFNTPFLQHDAVKMINKNITQQEERINTIKQWIKTESK